MTDYIPGSPEAIADDTRRAERGDHKSIRLNHKPFTTDRVWCDAPILLALMQAESDYKVFIEGDEGDRQLRWGEWIKLENGMRIYAIPPANFA